MKIASVRDFRNKATAFLKDDEPILVTRHGKVTGLYLPLGSPESLPLEVRRELLEKFGEYISRSLEAKGVKEKEILEDFKAVRESRRRR